MCFGDRLKIVRKEKGFTLEHLASLIDTSEVVIRNYEKSRRIPNVEMLIRLCNALNVTPNYLLQDDLTTSCFDNEILEKVALLTAEQRCFLNDFLNTLLERNNTYIDGETK